MKYQIKDYEDVRKMVEQMSEEELIYSVICPAVSDESPVAYEKVPAIFFHSRQYFEDNMSKLKQLKRSPLIVEDMEGMYVPMRACANSGEDRLAYEVGRHIGVDGVAGGYHWGLGPCVDITGNPDCPIVHTRTPGKTVDDNIKYGIQVIKGMQEHGIIATAKHFPGDGYCAYDQHLCTAENPLSFSEWKNTFGCSYQAFIEAGVKAIMPGHISLPSYDEPDEKTGLYRPATLSKRLMTDLLKGELGFEGIIITDAVNMAGFCGYMNYYRACAESLEAGADCLLFAIPDDMFMNNMHVLIKEGVLTIKTLKDRAYRMWCFVKEHTKERGYKKDLLSKKEKVSLAEELGRKAPCVERDRYHQLPLPLHKESRVLINIINAEPANKIFIEQMVNKIKNKIQNVDVIEDVGPEVTVSQIRENKYSAVICFVAPVMQAYGTNLIRLCGPIARNMMGGWQRLGTPVVFITPSVSIYKEYEALMDILINTNGSIQTTTWDTIMDIIMGASGGLEE